jgi:hypothetical protein
MVMSLQQWLRCPAIDADGSRCVLYPSHQGKHEFRRCDWTDAEGYRCFLPPSHPGDHELAWYSRPTAAGAIHRVRYPGRHDDAAAQADEDAQELAPHHWFPASRAYVPKATVSLSRIFALIARRKPEDELVVVYTYRPPAQTAATTR